MSGEENRLNLSFKKQKTVDAIQTVVTFSYDAILLKVLVYFFYNTFCL
jgi:hypothetical protein